MENAQRVKPVEMTDSLQQVFVHSTFHKSSTMASFLPVCFLFPSMWPTLRPAGMKD